MSGRSGPAARGALATALLLAALPWVVACRAPVPDERTAAAGAPRGTLVVCGQRFATAAPVIPWFQPHGYDAYRTEPRAGSEGPIGLRYRPGRRAPAFAPLPGEGEDDELERLRRAVDLLVLHYDACGTSRRCFEVLHDRRGLSVHFLLDVDGTLYQTLDLREEAWHAREANPRSIGVEIAHVGAYPPGDEQPLASWYVHDAGGPRLVLPEEHGVLRPAEASLRPARPETVVGEVNGGLYAQPDFTPEQYASLALLAASLAELFPRLALDAPRDAAGEVRRDALAPEELDAFRGIVGHWHVSADKRDPGPAFDWERWLGEVRRLAAQPRDGSQPVSARSPGRAGAAPAPRAPRP